MTDCRRTGFGTTLRDGRTVHIRAKQPADEAELLQAFNPDERRRP
jgi:hypothetical protein